MLNFHFLGTCSGTEPFPDMHHQSWILTAGGIHYWFDAGENCAHRAHSSGVDIMRTAALFISHPHIDHIGGLPLLLACIQKLTRRFKKQFIRNNTLQLFFPDMERLKAVMAFTFAATPPLVYDLQTHPIADGLLFEDENIRVTALHNRHMKEDGSNGWHSYSFLIEAEGKRIVFSGDVASYEELLPLIGEGCDMLIAETGHHDVKEVMDFAVSHNVKNLRLTHHGRAILENRPLYEALAAEYRQKSPTCVRICFDGMEETL